MFVLAYLREKLLTRDTDKINKRRNIQSRVIRMNMKMGANHDVIVAEL